MGAARRLRRQAEDQGEQLKTFMQNERQAVINPYENVTSLAGMISNPYANTTNPYANITNPYANMTNAYANVTNPFANMSNAFADMTNPYADMANAYEGMTNAYANVTNPFENLQVSTRAAQFQAEQSDISLASTLDTMRSLGSGAGGATALAREAAAGKQGIAASIEQQEAQNSQLRAQGEQQRQMAVAQGQQTVDMAKAGAQQSIYSQQAQGEAARQMAIAQGAMSLQSQYGSAEMNRQMQMAQGAMDIQNLSAQGAFQTQMAIAQGEQWRQGLLGEGNAMAMQMQLAEAERLQNADIFGKTFMFQAQEQRDIAEMSRMSALQQQYLQGSVDIKSANRQMWGNIISGVAQGVGAAIGSERKLKKNIKLIGKSPSGINMYEFEYKDKKHGDGVYQGIMVDEAPLYAVVDMGDHLGIDYSKIDVEFKRIR